MASSQKRPIETSIHAPGTMRIFVTLWEVTIIAGYKIIQYRYWPIVFLLTSLPTHAFAESEENPPLRLQTFGVMYVGSELVQRENYCDPSPLPCSDKGTQVVNQARVEYFIPEELTTSYPLVLMHGLGLTADMYLSLPGGGEGWAQFFARRGHPVYTITLPSVIASGLDVESYNATAKGKAEPNRQSTLYSWAPEVFWRSFGYGDNYPALYEGVQFQIENLADLLAGSSPYIFANLAESQQTDLAALLSLLRQIGPAVLVTHSLSGGVGFDALQSAPDRIAGIIALEPADGCPVEFGQNYGQRYDGKFLLSVWGDHSPGRRNAEQRIGSCAAVVSKIREASGKADQMLLPELGIHGNTHMIPVDANSEEVAMLIYRWLNKSD